MAKNIIIDKRQDPLGGSVGNRQRFLQRAKKHMKESLQDAFKERSLKDSTSSETITVTGGLAEPKITYSYEGRWWDVFFGNDRFVRGDKIQVPPQNENGRGCRSGQSDEKENDDYEFIASSDEFYDLIFDGLALPKMQRVGEFVTKEHKHAGLSPVGLPNNLDLPRTYAKAMVRNMAMQSAMQEEIEELAQKIFESKDTEEQDTLKAEIEDITEEIDNIPPYDDMDCVYRVKQEIRHRTRKAVMFCLMDVSGSMTQQHKYIAKQFYLLLNRFLESKYDECEVVFIRYHSDAIECDEDEFFNSTETGGTSVSAATQLATQIMESRYPKDRYNIYVALCSDGDTGWNYRGTVVTDGEKAAQDISKWASFVRQFYYIDLLNDPDEGYTELMEELVPVEATHSNAITLAEIELEENVIPVFRKIFTNN